MTDDLFTPDDTEPLGEGGTWLLDLVAVVDHFNRGYRPGFTVWDALEEAIRHALPTETDDGDTSSSESSDPLADALRCVANQPSPPPVALRLQRAVRRWVIEMAQRSNSGAYWPHPQARRSFPPPFLILDDLPDDTT